MHCKRMAVVAMVALRVDIQSFKMNLEGEEAERRWPAVDTFQGEP